METITYNYNLVLDDIFYGIIVRFVTNTLIFGSHANLLGDLNMQYIPQCIYGHGGYQQVPEHIQKESRKTIWKIKKGKTAKKIKELKN